MKYIKDDTTDIQKIPHEDRIKLDFLCVGFMKCGTTSLQGYLEKNENIWLPTLKETSFISQVIKTSHEDLIRFYRLDKPKKKLVGGIEPSYWMYPKRVKEYFGDEIKLIFCVRNPVDALLSRFKMDIRWPSCQEILDLYKKYERASIDMFREYLKNKRDVFCYGDVIEEWLKYFPKEQILVLISEEMFLESKRSMKQLYSFIGLEENTESNEFPHINRGSTVSCNYDAARINYTFFSHYKERRRSEICSEEKQRYEILRRELDKITTERFDELIPEDLYQELMEYYMPSIRKLEIILEKSFENIWY